MSKVTDGQAHAGEAADEAHAVARHHLHNSEGEDLGTALGVLSLGAVLVCVAGIGLAALALRS